MADNNFDILIRILTQQVGSEKASDILKQVKEETIATGKEGVKQEEQVGAATGKTISLQHQLKEAVKGVRHEFPILGRIGHLALNPIIFGVSAISAAAAILYEKLSAVGEVMKTSAWEPAKLNESAEAWKKFSVWVKESAAAATTLEAKLARIVQYTQTINRLAAAQAQDLSANPLFARRAEEAKATAMEKAAGEARATAAQMRADAGSMKPKHTAADDASTQTTLDQEEATAKKEIERVDAEIKWAEEHSEPSGNAFKDFVGGGQYVAKYGLSRPEEIIAALKQERGGYQGFVDRAAGARTRTETFNAKRTAATDLGAKADEFDKFAADQEKAARDTRFTAGLSYYESAKGQGVTPPTRQQPTPYGVTPDIKAYFDKANADLKAIAAEWSAAAATMRKDAEAEAARSKNRSQRP